MLLALLYRSKYPKKKVLILTTDAMLKDQLVEEITNLTDDKDIWFDIVRDVSKTEFSAVLVDEIDVWALDNAIVFL